MTGHALVTGGAGFIGSHVADALLRRGYRVRVLDSLETQVHGGDRTRPSYLDPEIELVVGDVRDPDIVASALRGIDVVFHFAARVGVGQSMYEVADYTSVNNLGTAVLMEKLCKKPVARLVVASSMSIYGEGLYIDGRGAHAPGETRDLARLREGDWELRGPDGAPLVPVPTPEWKAPALESVYALSKYDQERLTLMLGRAYGMSTVALRFFNAYGPRQALSNPYTGVLAIFASRLLNDRSPLVYEDGRQQRDFVSVHDVVRACLLALTRERASGGVFNIGSGQPQSILDVAAGVARAVGKPHLLPEVTGKYRMGDIRHCFADIASARESLGYEPEVSFQDGIVELADWLRTQTPRDRAERARAELESRGLQL
jgi:dTDP-L-rhamnose 4-epimerase